MSRKRTHHQRKSPARCPSALALVRLASIRLPAVADGARSTRFETSLPSIRLESWLEQLEVAWRGSQSENDGGAHALSIRAHAPPRIEALQLRLLQALIHEIHKILSHLVVLRSIDIHHVPGAVGGVGNILAIFSIEIQMIHGPVRGRKRCG